VRAYCESAPRRRRFLFASSIAAVFSVASIFNAHNSCGAGDGDANGSKPAIPAFPLEFRIVDPDNPENAAKKADERLPPLFVAFPKGLTHEGKDATGPIERLEAFRGKSKLLPKSNDNLGLPVVLRGLRFVERRDGDGKLAGYDVELQGEFNAVKVSAPDEAMKSFLARKPTVFELESKLQYGIISTHSTTKLQIVWAGDRINIESVEGDFSFREGFYTYKSATLKTEAPKGRGFLYYGEAGELPKLRIL